MIVTSQSDWCDVHWATCGRFGSWHSNLNFKRKAKVVSFVHWLIPTCFTHLRIQQSKLNFLLLEPVAFLTPALAEVSKEFLVASVHPWENWHPSYCCFGCFCVKWIKRHWFKGVEMSTMKMEVQISDSLSLMMAAVLLHQLDSTDSNLDRPYRERWDD